MTLLLHGGGASAHYDYKSDQVGLTEQSLLGGRYSRIVFSQETSYIQGLLILTKG